MCAALDLGRECRIVHRRKIGAMRRRRDADQARTAPRKRNQCERTFLGVEFGRRLVVCPRMRQIECERGLRIGAATRADPGSRPTHRVCPVGADRKPHPRNTVRMPDRDCRRIAFDRERRRRDRIHIKRSGARLQRRNKMPILDVVAECFAINFGGGEHDLGGPDEPLRIVDDAQFFQWRGFPRAVLPEPQRVERRHRASQKRGRAMVSHRGRRDQQCLDAGRSKRDCADQSSGSGTDNCNFGCQRRLHRDSGITGT